MFLELIATFFAGFGAAGLVLVVNMLTGGRLPKWAMPVAAGAAMIVLTISNEYTWYGRTVSDLPEGLVAVDTVSRSDWYRPWSFVAPITYRLIAVAPDTARTRDAQPDVKLVDVFMFERWQAGLAAQQLVDCGKPAAAVATPAALEDPSAAAWGPAGASLVDAVCRGAQS